MKTDEDKIAGCFFGIALMLIILICATVAFVYWNAGEVKIKLQKDKMEHEAQLRNRP